MSLHKHIITIGMNGPLHTIRYYSTVYKTPKYLHINIKTLYQVDQYVFLKYLWSFVFSYMNINTVDIWEFL